MAQTAHTPGRVKYPFILDVTNATIAAHPGMHVIRDEAGIVVALCPIYEAPVCEGQFSHAPIVHRALNSYDDMLMALKDLLQIRSGRTAKAARAAIAKAEGRS